jgi:FkbM family methyltransferase
MPVSPSKAVAYARSLAAQLAVAKGPSGKLAVLRVIAAGRRGATDRAPVGVAMKALGGRELYVRPGTSDLRNAAYYYDLELFLPAPELAGEELRCIVELGSNMGAALTALAIRYPTAALLGVEPDPGNAALAARNVAPFGDRSRVVEAGIWDTDADLVVDRDTRYGEHGFSVRPRTGSDPAGLAGIRARSIDSVLAEHLPGGEQVDYLHLTIEGTEPRVLAAGGAWPARVRSLRVEAHPELGYPPAACVADLEELGYRAWPDSELPQKWVFAVRR